MRSWLDRHLPSRTSAIALSRLAPGEGGMECITCHAHAMGDRADGGWPADILCIYNVQEELGHSNRYINPSVSVPRGQYTEFRETGDDNGARGETEASERIHLRETSRRRHPKEERWLACVPSPALSVIMYRSRICAETGPKTGKVDMDEEVQAGIITTYSYVVVSSHMLFLTMMIPEYIMHEVHYLRIYEMKGNTPIIPMVLTQYEYFVPLWLPISTYVVPIQIERMALSFVNIWYNLPTRDVNMQASELYTVQLHCIPPRTFSSEFTTCLSFPPLLYTSPPRLGQRSPAILWVSQMPPAHYLGKSIRKTRQENVDWRGANVRINISRAAYYAVAAWYARICQHDRTLACSISTAARPPLMPPTTHHSLGMYFGQISGQQGYADSSFGCKSTCIPMQGTPIALASVGCMLFHSPAGGSSASERIKSMPLLKSFVVLAKAKAIAAWSALSSNDLEFVVSNAKHLRMLRFDRGAPALVLSSRDVKIPAGAWIRWNESQSSIANGTLVPVFPSCDFSSFNSFGRRLAQLLACPPWHLASIMVE
ncbi:hypothetical protein ACRALDRAFT_205543 [Sodiomyces alcalophilus JCM 7366]|uniref:uncharacterized protein n=1 Tax=Sodiomyces alcalophilus JCM 7366 TaxID=591952 RepID=UPI0039B618FA